MTELLIQHNNNIYAPSLEDSVTWTTERQGVPGKLEFKLLKDDTLELEEGDPVRLKVDDNNVFYGFIFTIKHSADNEYSITCYDQLRYLKNKDTRVYSNITASGIISELAGDFRLKTGYIADTGFVIASRVEDNTTLFDMIKNALDITLQNSGKLYVLYDDFGSLTLKSLEEMKTNLLIDEDTAQGYDYTSTIDTATYNQVKLTFDNKDTGEREVYITKDGDHINKWGVLQYFEKINEGENGRAKADALLNLYNHKTRSLLIKSALGDHRVRAGSMVVVILAIGDLKLKNYMLVEKCKHTYKESEHWMDLTLRGGEISG